MVMLRSRSQCPLSFSFDSHTFCSFGVLIPGEKVFIFGQFVTITSVKEGNLKVKFIEQKLVRLAKQSSFRLSNFQKMISFPASSPLLATISVTILHSFILIAESCTRLLAVEDVTKYFNASQSHTCKAVRFPKDDADGAKLIKLSQLLTSRVSRFWRSWSTWRSWFQIFSKSGRLKSFKCSILARVCSSSSTSRHGNSSLK